MERTLREPRTPSIGQREGLFLCLFSEVVAAVAGSVAWL
jgi:hypothetical protein